MTADSVVSFHIGLSSRRATRARWGDTAYARGLARALEARGHLARLFFRDETPDWTGAGDVVLRIVGPHLDEPVAGVPNFLWIISPPNLAPRAILARFATVFVGSQQLATDFAQAGLVAEYMPQATDPGVFNPDAGREDAERHDIAFVGNLASRAARSNVRSAIACGLPVTVWGEGWDGEVPAQHFGGARLGVKQLASVYARSRIVLNSHMPIMSSLGMMSNRSFDALACGAVVLSDRVVGFSDPDLPDLIQTGPQAEFLSALQQALEAPVRTPSERAATSADVAARYSFDVRARRFIKVAWGQLRKGARARAAFHPLDPRPAQGNPVNLDLSDRAATPLAPAHETAALLDTALASRAVTLTLTLSDPTEEISACSGEVAVQQAALAVLRIGAVLERIGGYAGFTVSASGTEARTGVIHPMMTDHLEAQALAQAAASDPNDPAIHTEMLRLTTRARRLLDTLGDSPAEFGLGRHFRNRPEFTVRCMNNRPLFAHAPEGYDRDKEKPHLLLWPRASPPATERPIGVFLHLHYTDTAQLFADRLRRMVVPHSVYISTDNLAKAVALAEVFPQAEIRILPNRGRDIWPKLYGFADRHGAHDLVLHLHGKKSTHAQVLDSWLDLALDCLLPSEAEINRIVSLFQSVPSLGIVAPLTHRAVLGAAHWGDNLELAQEIMRRTRLDHPLPGNDQLQFPVGSMFWARRNVLQPLIDLALTSDHFPPEAGQLDGTPAHAIERLFGVVCAAAGAHLIRVAPQGSVAHRAHQVLCKRNGELRAALESGAFGARC